ncbi:hypothetical protein ACJMK2_025450 [Sinanodonta woodiana]|uniref:Uncharacterized protein n=1 Tax=Sinanodonta woodiana TaxID=1069815 RepID=A0ABD3XH31_SINWO
MWQTANTLQSSRAVYHGVCGKMQIPCSLQGQYTMVYGAKCKYPAVFRVSISWCMWQNANTMQSSGSVYHDVCGKLQIPCSLHGQYTMMYVANCKCPAVFRVSIPWCMWQNANTLQSSRAVYHDACGKLQIPCSLQGQYTMVYVANYTYPAVFTGSIP